MAAVQGVTVSADLPGTVERIAFDSGTAVREGEVLALLDTRQERAQLAAAEAQRELARLNFDRMQGLLNERVISRAEFDRATAEDRQAEARVGGDPRRDRAEDDPGAVLRRSSASGRSTSASTSSAATRWSRCSRSIRST